MDNLIILVFVVLFLMWVFRKNEKKPSFDKEQHINREKELRNKKNTFCRDNILHEYGAWTVETEKEYSSNLQKMQP